MKHILYNIIVLMLLAMSQTTWAQDANKRTTNTTANVSVAISVDVKDTRNRSAETIIQDVLALVPIQQQADFNAELQPLVQAAPQSIVLLSAMLRPAVEHVNAKVEYTLHGAVCLAGTEEKWRQAVSSGLEQAIAAQTDPDAKQFLQNELRLLKKDNDVTYVNHAASTPYAKAYDKLVSLGEKAGAQIVKDMKSKDRVLRMQSLKYATANALANDGLAAAIVKSYKKLGEDAKCDVLAWLGDNKMASQKPLLLSVATQGGKPGKAAIEALGKLGGDDAQQVLLSQLGGENSAEAFRALCSYPGKLNLLEPLKIAEGDKKLALLKLASARHCTDTANDIFKLVADKTYGDAAVDALPGVVTPKQINFAIAALVADKAREDKWQKVCTAALQSLGKEEQYTELSKFLADSKLPNKESLYPLLAATGTDASVADLEKIGDKAALGALCKSKNYKAAKSLLAAAKQGNQEALMSYVRLVNANEKDLDRRSERLIEAYSLAQGNDNKKAILTALETTPTRNAFLHVGKILDDKALAYSAATAAKAIINKTTEDIEYDVVKATLGKCIDIFKATGNADDGYAVDELRQKLSELQPVPLYTLSDEEKAQGFELLFDGSNLDNFVGNKVGYVPINGCINVTANYGNESNLYTKNEYRDFIFRFEFCFLRSGVNNGVGLRTPMGVDAAYDGMCEVQILDHDDPIYAGLREYQVHGSVYGVIPAKRIKHKPLGEWSEEEIRVKGNHITVTVNGEVILDGDIKEACQGHNVAPDGSDKNPYTVDHKNHPGMFNKKGHIGFLGHGAGLKFRAVRVLDLTKKK